MNPTPPDSLVSAASARPKLTCNGYSAATSLVNPAYPAAHGRVTVACALAIVELRASLRNHGRMDPNPVAGKMGALNDELTSKSSAKLN
jgi:hypothetical protein